MGVAPIKICKPKGMRYAAMEKEAVCSLLDLTGCDERKVFPLDDDPSNLKAAIVFGILYVVVLFAVTAVLAEDRLRQASKD